MTAFFVAFGLAHDAALEQSGPLFMRANHAAVRGDVPATTNATLGRP